jgi:hypothetical protein
MKKIILLTALALLNTNISASENPGFFSKNFLKEGLAHTESNIVVTGGTIYNFVTLIEYFQANNSIPINPALTIGYEKKYSDDSALLANISVGSNVAFNAGPYDGNKTLKHIFTRAQCLWTFNIFQKENFFIDYGLGLHLGLVVKLQELKREFFTAGLSPIYLSFNWNITDNVTAICALIPFPPGLGIFYEQDLDPISVNDSFEIGVKIKM